MATSSIVDSGYWLNILPSSGCADVGGYDVISTSVLLSPLLPILRCHSFRWFVILYYMYLKANDYIMKFGFCTGFKGIRFKRSTYRVQKVHFIADLHPAKKSWLWACPSPSPPKWVRGISLQVQSKLGVFTFMVWNEFKIEVTDQLSNWLPLGHRYY